MAIINSQGVGGWTKTSIVQAALAVKDDPAASPEFKQKVLDAARKHTRGFVHGRDAQAATQEFGQLMDQWKAQKSEMTKADPSKPAAPPSGNAQNKPAKPPAPAKPRAPQALPKPPMAPPRPTVPTPPKPPKATSMRSVSVTSVGGAGMGKAEEATDPHVALLEAAHPSEMNHLRRRAGDQAEYVRRAHQLEPDAAYHEFKSAEELRNAYAAHQGAVPGIGGPRFKRVVQSKPTQLSFPGAMGKAEPGTIEQLGPGHECDFEDSSGKPCSKPAVARKWISHHVHHGDNPAKGATHYCKDHAQSLRLGKAEPKAPRYDQKKGWTGGEKNRLYHLTDKMTGQTWVKPVEHMRGVGENVDIRHATRGEAEEKWQKPLHPGWKVQEDLGKTEGDGWNHLPDQSSKKTSHGIYHIYPGGDNGAELHYSSRGESTQMGTFSGRDAAQKFADRHDAHQGKTLGKSESSHVAEYALPLNMGGLKRWHSSCLAKDDSKHAQAAKAASKSKSYSRSAASSLGGVCTGCGGELSLDPGGKPPYNQKQQIDGHDDQKAEKMGKSEKLGKAKRSDIHSELRSGKRSMENNEQRDKRKGVQKSEPADTSKFLNGARLHYHHLTEAQRLNKSEEVIQKHARLVRSYLRAAGFDPDAGVPAAVKNPAGVDLTKSSYALDRAMTMLPLVKTEPPAFYNDPRSDEELEEDLRNPKQPFRHSGETAALQQFLAAPSVPTWNAVGGNTAYRVHSHAQKKGLTGRPGSPGYENGHPNPSIVREALGLNTGLGKTLSAGSTGAASPDSGVNGSALEMAEGDRPNDASEHLSAARRAEGYTLNAVHNPRPRTNGRAYLRMELRHNGQPIGSHADWIGSGGPTGDQARQDLPDPKQHPKARELGDAMVNAFHAYRQSPKFPGMIDPHGGLGKAEDKVIGHVGKGSGSSKKPLDIGDGYHVHSHGYDANGNHSVWVSKGSGSTRKIQTGQNTPTVHSARGSGDKGKLPISEKGAQEIKDHHKQYVEKPVKKSESEGDNMAPLNKAHAHIHSLSKARSNGWDTLRLQNRGAGGFLNPPGHPEHTQSFTNRRGDMRSLSSVLDDPNPSGARGQAKKLLSQWQANRAPLDSPEVQDWIHQTLGYFKGGYKSTKAKPGEEWHASNLEFDSKRDPIPHADTHAGVNAVRRFYPEFQPTPEHFQNAYWGQKPTPKTDPTAQQQPPSTVKSGDSANTDLEKGPRSPRPPKPHNEDAVRELHLFADNDADLYRQMKTPIERNLANKMAAGQYDHAKAGKGFQYLADAAAQKYQKQFGSQGSQIFTPADRAEVGRRLADSFRTEAGLGNMDHHLQLQHQRKKVTLKDHPATKTGAPPSRGEDF